MPSETQEIKSTLLDVFLGPFKRMLQNEVVFVLMLMLTAGGYAMYWAAGRLESFATIQIPKHIEQLNQGTKDVVTEFTTKTNDMAKGFREELDLQRKHYVDLRVEDEKHLDRIERLTIGKKTAGAVSAAPSENTADQ